MLGDPRQAYTFPDRAHDRLGFAALSASRFLSDAALLGGSLYLRHNRNDGFASNVNGAFGAVDPRSGAIDTVAATNDESLIDQRGVGGGLQLTLKGSVRGTEHQFVLGVATDAGRARFTQRRQSAAFTPKRATIATGPFALTSDASTTQRADGVFVSDTLLLDARWSVSLAGRYSRARASRTSPAAPRCSTARTATHASTRRSA